MIQLGPHKQVLLHWPVRDDNILNRHSCVSLWLSDSWNSRKIESPPQKKIKLEETPGPAAVEIFLQDRDL